jgi:peroxiredoxin
MAVRAAPCIPIVPLAVAATLLACACACACAPARAPQAPDMSLPGSDGRLHSLRESSVTVLVFFSPSCAYQTAHDARLAALSEAYASRGVAFFAVDSESTGSLERDRAEAERRHYPFPILRDDGGVLARAVAARYSTASIVAARDGRVLYEGAIDSDGLHLHGDARLYLRDAIESALAGRSTRVMSTVVPGCALTLW